MSHLFELGCSAIPTIAGSELRFSVSRCQMMPISTLPLKLISLEELAPSQCRMQWGVNTCGLRYDSYKGLRLGNEENNFEMGFRTTYSDSLIAPVENQRVGYAAMTINGQFKLSYWNDHSFWWWPFADGGDKGDTAGVSMAYLLGKDGFPLSHGWNWRNLSLSLRLASGIPDKGSVVAQGNQSFYTKVEFSGIDRGDINLNATLTKNNRQRLDIGVGVNSGAVRNFTQSELIHKNLGIPQFPKTNQLEFYIYLKLQTF
jgi:hypothetical protein